MKTILLWTLALFMLAAPGAAEAITVSIQATRGSSTVTQTPTFAFTDSAGNPAIALACTNSSTVVGTPNSTALPTLCTRTISVGGTTVQIKDVSTTNRARVYRIDAGSDILHVAGLQATSGTGITTTSGVTLKISYSSNEYAKLNFGLYSYTAAMSGNLINANGQTPIACNSTTPCLTLTLKANLVDVNQFGPVATVVVPPLSGGAFGPPTLNPSETKSINCGTAPPAPQPSCTPSLQGALTWIIKSSGELLKVTAGATIGGSHRPTTAGGVVDTFVDVAAPEFLTPLDVFVDYTQEATLHAILTQDGAAFRNITNKSTIPLSWHLEKVVGFETEESTLFRSIVTNTDLHDNGAYASWVPTPQVTVGDVTFLAASFQWVTGDCASSWFVKLQLETLEEILIFLGGSPDFLTLCNTNFFDGVNLRDFNGKNVKLPDGTFTSWNSMKGRFGSTRIRAISLFLTETTANQEVELTSFSVGTFGGEPVARANRSPVFGATCDFPGMNEFTMRWTPVNANGEPTGGPAFVWGDLPSETFVENGCQLRSQVPVLGFPNPGAASGFWRIELLFNLVPVGQGFIRLL